MISFPTLPTDSLYKFLFVFGIILIVTALYFANQNIQADKKELLSSLNLENKYKLKVQSINHSLDSMNHSLDSIEKSRNRLVQKGDSLNEQFYKHKRHSTAEIKKIDAFMSQAKIILEKKLKATKIHANQSEYKWNKLKDTMDFEFNMVTAKEKGNHLVNNFYSTILIITFSIGIIFTLVGGLLWYVKSQRHLDRILAIQADQMEVELNSKSKIAGRIHFEPRNLPRKQIQNKNK